MCVCGCGCGCRCSVYSILQTCVCTVFAHLTLLPDEDVVVFVALRSSSSISESSISHKCDETSQRDTPPRLSSRKSEPISSPKNPSLELNVPKV